MGLRIITAFSIAFLISACNTAKPLENVVTAKMLLRCEKPEYPRESLANEHQGVVTMSFHVSKDGTLLESKIERSSGHPPLDFAAIRALSKCPFKPKTVDGIPEDSWVKMQYVWKLE
jgi:periplasmic protein TonB